MAWPTQNKTNTSNTLETLFNNSTFSLKSLLIRDEAQKLRARASILCGLADSNPVTINEEEKTVKRSEGLLDINTFHIRLRSRSRSYMSAKVSSCACALVNIAGYFASCLSQHSWFAVMSSFRLCSAPRQPHQWCPRAHGLMSAALTQQLAGNLRSMWTECWKNKSLLALEFSHR